MRESPVMSETEDWAAELPYDVKIGSFGRKRQGGGRQRCLAIQPRAPDAGAGQKVSDGFQWVMDIVIHTQGQPASSVVERSSVVNN